MQVAVKIINHSKDCSQIQDIRVLRETLFSTSLLHPNIVVSAGMPGRRSQASKRGICSTHHAKWCPHMLHQ
jgi:hypothetical protein